MIQLIVRVVILVRGRFDSTSCILKDVDELVEGDALTLFRGTPFLSRGLPSLMLRSECDSIVIL